ncbi:MAG: hypothetical protein HYS04_15850, partial [Acidobacteria bacterium]|nr:hypothetical protein [Acidobacteriota bacterium]
MTIASDRSVYTPGAGMIARLRVRNSTGHPVQLNFPTGQSFDFVIRNEAGDIVQRWSEGKFFTQALRSETLAPGERN